MKKSKLRIQITDLSADQYEVQQLQILSESEVIGISGGAGSYEPTLSGRGTARGRNRSSYSCYDFPC